MNIKWRKKIRISTLHFTSNKLMSFRLRIHSAIYRPDSFVVMLHYFANLKALRYESTTLNRIVADNSHRAIVALEFGCSEDELQGLRDVIIITQGKIINFLLRCAHAY